MPNSPALGAKVTVVDEHGRLRHAEVWGHQFKGQFQWVAPAARGAEWTVPASRADGFMDDDAEGVHWARGWLPEYTVEAHALEAAHKLARSAE